MTDTICPQCHKPESAHTEATAADCWETYRQAEVRQELSTELLSRQYVAPETLQATFETLEDKSYQQKPIIDCRGFWGSSRRFLLLYGDYGTGKTHLARCILCYVMGLGRRAIEVKAITLARNVRGFKEWKLMGPIKSVSILLIDDLEKANWDLKAIQGLWEILDTRYDRGLKTIITSNLTPGQLHQKMQNDCPESVGLVESMFQRLHPMTGIEMRGESLR